MKPSLPHLPTGVKHRKKTTVILRPPRASRYLLGMTSVVAAAVPSGGAFFGWPGQLVVRVAEGNRKLFATGNARFTDRILRSLSKDRLRCDTGLRDDIRRSDRPSLTATIFRGLILRQAQDDGIEPLPHLPALSARWLPFTLLLLPLLFTACMVGPDYTQPTTPTPTAYKNPVPWKPAAPKDDVIRGKWWEIYHDPELNALEEQVNISNQNVLQAEAQFREAAAAVKVARAGLLPTITANPAYTISQSSQNLNSGNFGGGNFGGGANVQNLYDLPLEASYMVDVWGGIRRNVQAATNTAQASFANLENARLSYQATLAVDYYSLKGLDAQAQLLSDTAASYQKYLDLTNNRYNSGIASKGDVAQATTQLETTKAEFIAVGVQRAQYEDAIATLIGKPASEFKLGKSPLTGVPPAVPLALPAELLERRPDIAQAERTVASANASIGVAVSAYYPAITLNANTGLESISLSQLFSGPSFLWSVGPVLAQTLFNGGQTHGQVQEAQATYEAEVAAYRQTTLTAFQQVEDDLSGLRILRDEAVAQADAVKAAKESLDVATNLYKAGTDDYLDVIVAQATYLNNQITDNNVRTSRMTTSVLLIEALGGGWDVSQLPATASVADVPQAQAQISKNKK